MIKKLLLMIIMVAGFAATGMAQENMYLIKGNQVVAKYSVDDVDYVSFKLPEGVKESQVTVNVDEVGKNYFTYTVKTLSPTKEYAHYFVQKSMIDIYLLTYYGTTVENSDPELVTMLLKNYLYNGFLAAGTSSYTIRDGESDGYEDFDVIAGTDYFVMACDLDATGQDLGDNFDYKLITTEPAGRSAGTVSATYAGLNERGEAMFNFTASGEITKICTMYGLKASLESFINAYGFYYTMFTYAGRFAPADLIPGDGNGWPVNGEGDYAMYVVGIDANGDQTEVQKVETHIVPPVPEHVGPQIKIFSKEKSEGKVSVNFEITPSNITEAYVRLMDENDCDDRMNAGYTLPELAAGGDAIDITNKINTEGEYTYVNDEVPTRWNSLLIMAKNGEGTTITRMNFWPDTESEWDITENTSFSSTRANAPRKTAVSKNNAPKLAIGKGKPAFKVMK
ncbi:MAG: hypothetical protein Q4C43_05775 [Prevotella sp.]|nr:hypothetical protein [Prevotella sp.]